MKDKIKGGMTCFRFEKIMDKSPLSSNNDCLILESDPNPDYYAKGNFPPNKHDKSWHLYLPIKNTSKCLQDTILRNMPRFKSELGIRIKIALGELTLQNVIHPCIRMNTKEIQHLPLLLKELKKLGIQFLKDKKIKSGSIQVNYTKYIEFVELEENVYRDKFTPEFLFFSIPREIGMGELKEGVKRIKNNCDFHHFDCFLSYIPGREKILDFVGIYSKHCDEKRISEFKDEIASTFRG